MKEDEIEKILFQFLCEFLDSSVKRFDLTDYEHRQALSCDELWDLNNGVTLCEDCHNLTKRG